MLRKFWAIARSYDDKALRLIDLEMQGWAAPNATGKANRAKSEPIMQLREMEAVSAAKGSQAAQSSGGAVAIISLIGVMTKYASLCYYGTKDVIAAIEEANANAKVSAIVLVCDTPGGTVDGTEDLARAIAASAKPVVAYIDGCCCSAGYWAASQAREIIVNSEATAEVGSIGVIATYVNYQRSLEQDGIEVRLLRAPESPDKQSLNPYEPASEEAIAEVTDYLTAVRTRFVASIEQGRGARLNEAGRKAGVTGRVFTGRAAIDFGLVDKQGTLREAIARAAELAAFDARTSGTSALSQPAVMPDTPAPVPAAEAVAASAEATQPTPAPQAEAAVTEPAAEAEATATAPAQEAAPASLPDFTAMAQALASIQATQESLLERLTALEQRQTALASAIDAKPSPTAAGGDLVAGAAQPLDPVTARAKQMWG